MNIKPRRELRRIGDRWHILQRTDDEIRLIDRDADALRVPLHRPHILEFGVAVPEIHGRSTVGLLVLQLFAVPRGIKQTEVDHADVASNARCVLQVPDGESVVIAAGEKNRVLITALQQIICIVKGDVVVMAIMCLIVLGEHVDRTRYQQKNCQDNTHGFVFTDFREQHIHDAVDPDASPDRKGEE